MNKLFIIGTILSCTAMSFATSNEQEVQMEQEAVQASFEFSTFSKEQIEPHLGLLEDWVQREFKQYPYLWSPQQGEYCLSNVALLNVDDSLVTIVRKNGEVVGVAAGVAMDAPAFQEYLGNSVGLIKDKGFNPSEIVYMCYFLTSPEHRDDQALADAMYQQYVDFAHSKGKTQICYFEDFGRDDHPLKPENPTPIEPWNRLITGFRSMDVSTELSWQTLQADGTVQDEKHSAVFFINEV
jgi:hypothetical protein